jgi:hypothetical protein
MTKYRLQRAADGTAVQRATTTPVVPFKTAKRNVIEPFERAYISRLSRSYSSLEAASRASGLSRHHIRNLSRKYAIPSPSRSQRR